ncbi:MAG: hypothetical protein LBQ31_04075 [Bacteroidales bacterium]|jgi:hypothetical protein|nr:hypothetical protein [Bacteroidales bacterium]
MKKITTVFVALALFSLINLPAKAGGVYEGPDRGKSLLGVRLGVEFGALDINAAYDYALARVWKGSFTIGGQVGFGFNLWGGYGYYYGGLGGYTMPVMARTTYRFCVVTPKWEVYAGVALGARVLIYGGSGYGYGSGATATFAGGVIVGTNYYFTDKFGLNLEFNGGYGVSYLNFGVQFKF